MILVAFDPGVQKTGWSHFKDSHTVNNYGTFDFHKLKKGQARDEKIFEVFDKHLSTTKSYADHEGVEAYFVCEDIKLFKGRSGHLTTKEVQDTATTLARKHGYKICDPITPAVWHKIMKVEKGYEVSFVKGLFPNWYGDQDCACAVIIGLCCLQLMYEKEMGEEND